MDDLVKQLRDWFGTHPLIEEMIEENKRLRGLIVDAVYELEDGNASRAHAVLEREVMPAHPSPPPSPHGRGSA